LSINVTLRKNFALVFSVLIFILIITLSVLSLHEFYLIGILKQDSGYPFVCINENPWYYRTPQHYAYYNLGFGILSLFTALVFVKGLLQNREKYRLAAAVAMVSLLVFDFLGKIVIPC